MSHKSETDFNLEHSLVSKTAEAAIARNIDSKSLEAFHKRSQIIFTFAFSYLHQSRENRRNLTNLSSYEAKVYKFS